MKHKLRRIQARCKDAEHSELVEEYISKRAEYKGEIDMKTAEVIRSELRIIERSIKESRVIVDKIYGRGGQKSRRKVRKRLNFDMLMAEINEQS